MHETPPCAGWRKRTCGDGDGRHHKLHVFSVVQLRRRNVAFRQQRSLLRCLRRKRPTSPRERPPFVRPDSKEGGVFFSPDATDRLNFATRPLTPPLPPGLAARRPISSGRKHVPLTHYSPISYASMGDEPLMIVGDGRQMGNDAPQDQTSLRFAAKEQIKERRQQDLDDEAAYYKELLEGVGPALHWALPPSMKSRMRKTPVIAGGGKAWHRRAFWRKIRSLWRRTLAARTSPPRSSASVDCGSAT